MNFEESWNYFKTEINMTDTEYKKARFGINIRFDLNDYLKGRINIKSKSGKALIKGKSHDLEEFETEIEKRERLIKKWLLENCQEKEVAKPRGMV